MIMWPSLCFNELLSQARNMALQSLALLNVIIRDRMKKIVIQFRNAFKADLISYDLLILKEMKLIYAL